MTSEKTVDEQIHLIRHALAGCTDEERTAFELLAFEYRKLLAEKADK